MDRLRAIAPYLNPFNYRPIHLVGIAANIGLFGFIAMRMVVEYRRTKITYQQYYIDSFKLLRHNQVATRLIGEPIFAKKVDLSDPDNVFAENAVRLKVPFKGKIRRGELSLEANRSDVEDKWSVDRLEVVFEDMKDRKVVIYKCLDHEDGAGNVYS